MGKIFGMILLLLPLGLSIGAGPLHAESPEESLKKAFPRLKYESIEPSAVKGVYEVLVGDRILYFSPESEIIFLGDLMTRDGKNLTQEKIAATMAKKIKNIPLEKAVKIGTGKITVIEFSNPDCPFSRKAYEYFVNRTDVTRYVFMVPLPRDQRPNAESKAKYVLAATDKSKAYHEAMSGKLDDMKFKVPEGPQVEDAYQNHREISGRLGISGTPYFFVDGKMVRGANTVLIDKVLSEAKK